MILSVNMNAQYVPKPDFHQLVTLQVINENLYPVLDGVLNFKTKAENLKPGSFFTIEFDTDSLKPDLIVINAEGFSLYGYEKKYIGVVNYKDRTFLISGNLLDTTLFKRDKQFKNIDFSFKAVVGHLKDGTPPYDSRMFREVWCTWAYRYNNRKFKLIWFYSSDKKDTWFDNIEDEYKLTPIHNKNSPYIMPNKKDSNTETFHPGKNW